MAFIDWVSEQVKGPLGRLCRPYVVDFFFLKEGLKNKKKSIPIQPTKHTHKKGILNKIVIIVIILFWTYNIFYLFKNNLYYG